MKVYAYLAILIILAGAGWWYKGVIDATWMNKINSVQIEQQRKDAETKAKIKILEGKIEVANAKNKQVVTDLTGSCVDSRLPADLLNRMRELGYYPQRPGTK